MAALANFLQPLQSQPLIKGRSSPKRLLKFSATEKKNIQEKFAKQKYHYVQIQDLFFFHLAIYRSIIHTKNHQISENWTAGRMGGKVPVGHKYWHSLAFLHYSLGKKNICLKIVQFQIPPHQMGL